MCRWVDVDVEGVDPKISDWRLKLAIGSICSGSDRFGSICSGSVRFICTTAVRFDLHFHFHFPCDRDMHGKYL